MPWIAIHEGETVAPRQVPKGVDVSCPTCEERMRVRTRSSDGRARHFFHIGAMGQGEGSGSAACESVAESQVHKKWKSLAADRLEGVFEESVADCRMEKELAAPVSDKGKRLGDAVVDFVSPDEQLGKGLVVEVQHRNESKNIPETTSDYVAQGYSVVWTSSDDYGEDRCRLEEIDFRFRAKEAVWPHEVPKREEWWDISELDRLQNEWEQKAVVNRQT